jgi:hypothetical protein
MPPRLSKSVLRPTFASWLALVAALAPAGVAWADPPGFAFLEVPAGARASAMAGAYMSVGEGASAAWWDPAGLATVQRVEIAGSHYEFLQHLRHDQFVMAGPLWGGGTALSLRAMYSEPIVSRDELGNETGSFGSNDLEFMLAHGSSWGGGWRGGGSFQILHERIDFSSTTTWAVNGGLTYDPPARKAMRLALAVQNLGPAGKYGLDDGVKGEPVALPLALQGGGSYRWGLGGGWRLVGALEGRATRGRNAVGLLGAELGAGHGAAIRAGWRVNDPTLSWTMGVGWTVGGLTLDYAFVPFKLDLGDTHRLSFEARF